MIPPYLTDLISDRPQLQTFHGISTLTREAIGDLQLPSGRVVGADPHLAAEARPYARTVRPGSYPVSLSVVRFPDGEEQIAAAWLQFAEGLPVRWEYASCHEKPKVREPAYIVDSGSGSFMSAEAAAALEERGDDAFSELIYAELERTSRDWCVVPVPGAEPLTAAVFSSGYGDGVYATFWGFSGSGEPVRLLTDFDVLGTEADPGPPKKPWWKLW